MLEIRVKFAIVNTWKQLKCPLTDDCIKKTQYIYIYTYTYIYIYIYIHIHIYIYTMECCSTIKMNEIMPFAAT